MNYLEVYNKNFSINIYSVHDEQEYRYRYCMEFLNKNNIGTMIDIGSGRGVFLNTVKQSIDNINILSVDLNNYHNIEHIDFAMTNLANSDDRNNLLNKYENNKFELLTCLDVLEHLDKSFIEDVLMLFSKVSTTAILTIANHPEWFDGVELHTIQEDFSFWGPLINKYFDVLDYQEQFFHNGTPRLYVVTVKSK